MKLGVIPIIYHEKKDIINNWIQEEDRKLRERLKQQAQEREQRRQEKNERREREMEVLDRE